MINSKRAQTPPQALVAQRHNIGPSSVRALNADPLGAALAYAYAATLAEPLPPALADLLHSLE